MKYLPATSLVIGTLLIPSRAQAQGRWYQLGFSSSWGSSSSVICLDSLPPVCGKGRVSSHASFGFLSGGLSWVLPAKGPLSFETGALLAFKGWEVSTPGYLALYAEAPFLARLGTPDQSAIGAGFKGGLAAGLGIPPGVDLSTVLGADLRFRLKSGARLSFNVTRVVGLLWHSDFHLHTVLVLLGYQPAR